MKDRIKDWFTINILSHLTCESIISWIITLKIIFLMNSNIWDIIQDKRYDSLSDNSIMNYFYDKINLLKIINKEIDNNDIKKFIWYNLSLEFQFIFNYDEIQDLLLKIIDIHFLKKNSSFWKTWFHNFHIINQWNQLNRSSWLEYHKHLWKTSKISHFIDKIKNDKSISSK